MEKVDVGCVRVFFAAMLDVTVCLLCIIRTLQLERTMPFCAVANGE